MHSSEFYIWNKENKKAVTQRLTYVDAQNLVLETVLDRVFKRAFLGGGGVDLSLVVTSASLHPTFWILREPEAQHFSSACTSVFS